MTGDALVLIWDGFMGLGMLREAVTGVNRHYQLSCTGASKGKGREREGGKGGKSWRKERREGSKKVVEKLREAKGAERKSKEKERKSGKETETDTLQSLADQK